MEFHLLNTFWWYIKDARGTHIMIKLWRCSVINQCPHWITLMKEVQPCDLWFCTGPKVKKKDNGRILLALPPPPHQSHISVSGQCNVRSWWDPERGLKQVASVGILTKTSTSTWTLSLNVFFKMADLPVKQKIVLQVPNPNPNPTTNPT